MKYVELCNALSLYPSALVRIQLIHVHCFKFMVSPSFYRPKNIQGSTFDASVGRKELDKEVRLGRMTDPLRSYLAKTDLNNVFRLLPIYSSDFDFLGSKCNG